MPCRSSTGGPLPPRRPWIDAPAVAMSNSSNPSNMATNPFEPPRTVPSGRNGRSGLRLALSLSLSCRWPARRPPAPACRRMIPPWSSTMRSTAAHRVLGSGPKQALDRRGPDPHWWARPPGCPGTGKLSSPLAPLTSSRQRQCPHFPLAARPARAGPVRRWLDAPLHQGDRLMTPAARHCRTMFAPPPIVMSLSPAAARAWPSADSSPSVTTL